jgi:hypothetical protein
MVYNIAITEQHEAMGLVRTTERQTGASSQDHAVTLAALALLREAMDHGTRLLGPSHPILVQVMTDTAILLADMGHFKEALQCEHYPHPWLPNVRFAETLRSRCACGRLSDGGRRHPSTTWRSEPAQEGPYESEGDLTLKRARTFIRRRAGCISNAWRSSRRCCRLTMR